MRFIRGDSLKQAIARFHQPDTASARPTAGGALRSENGDSRDLAFRKLLRRFVDVCNAIDYAHSRGVLHRDIKPGNIIVGRYGETLVVDWGLAKATGRSDPGSPERTIIPISTSGGAETLPGSAVGTPAYMSPEQAAGRLEQLGPASDVYGLGATLYALLTGRAPFEGNVAHVLQGVQTGDYRPPRQLNPDISPALETVCLKAMALMPADRYASARALADDIERWLADEPVTARPEPWAEKARRWARKHRTLVTSAAAGVVIAALGLGAISAVQTKARNDLAAKNQALDLQRERAEDREQLAIKAMARFRDAVAQNPALKNTPALEELRRTLLKEPQAFFRALRDRLQADRDTRPESLARLAMASFDLGWLTDEIGNQHDALVAYQESLAIRQQLAAANPTSLPFQRDLAQSHNNVGALLLKTGNPAEALQAVEAARKIWEILAEADPNATELQSELANNLINTGTLLSETGKPAEALKAAEAARSIHQRLADANPSVVKFQTDLALSFNGIGNMLRELKKPAEALEANTAAISIQQKLHDASPGEPGASLHLAHSQSNIALLLSELGKPAEAMKAYEYAVAIQRRLLDENPTLNEVQIGLAKDDMNLANLRVNLGKPAEALEDLEAAAKILQRLAESQPSSAQYRRDLALCHSNIGFLLRTTRRPTEAMEAYRSAVAILQKLASESPDSPDLASDLGGTLNDQASIDLEAKRFEEARAELREAVTWQTKALAAQPGNPNYRQWLGRHFRNLIRACRGLGDSEGVSEAERELRRLHDSEPAIMALDAPGRPQTRRRPPDPAPVQRCLCCNTGSEFPSPRNRGRSQ
jgi:serine/threonine-protein kinase